VNPLGETQTTYGSEEVRLADKLPIAEIFYSVQGEGPSMGVPSVFVRMSHCNLRCPAWPCDTTEVWSKVWKYMTITDLLNYFRGQGWIDAFRNHAHLILTGGEPMLWQERWVPFVAALREEVSTRKGKSWTPYLEVETNGTITPTTEAAHAVQQWNISPKLTNSGNPLLSRYKPEVLKAFVRLRRSRGKKSCFKFVVDDQDMEGDLREIREMFLRPFHILSSWVYLMPEAVDRDELIKKSSKVAEMCKREGFNFSSRLQLILWNKVTGV
jgi:organic radical activating enzyme